MKPYFVYPQHSPFFAEQLTAFQVWLTMGVENRNPPEQLPIVLQVTIKALAMFQKVLCCQTKKQTLFGFKTPIFNITNKQTGLDLTAFCP